MIIDVLSDKELTTKQKLMLSLYYLGMADRQQLADLLHVTVHTIDFHIIKLNRKNKSEKHIITMSPLFKEGPKMYQLGPAGWKCVMDYLEMDRKYEEKSDFQRIHYRGMTNVLIRLIHALGREKAFEKVEYLNTLQATKLYRYPWEVAYWKEWQEDKKFRFEQEKELPHPDLRITVDGKSAWGEYDTGSQQDDQILVKLRRYYRTLPHIPESSGLKNPVVFITRKEERKKKLQNWNEIVKNEPEFRDLEEKPEMLFFVEGEDTEYFTKGLL